MKEIDVDRESWFEVARAGEAATFFHTPHWSDVARATSQWDDATVAVTLDDGARAVYPLLRLRRGRSPRLAPLVSGWAGCYGGPICERPLREEEQIELHRLVLRRAWAPVRVTLGPLTPPVVPDGMEVRADLTHVVDLPHDFETALMGFSDGHRRAYRKALRVGVRVREARDAAEQAAFTAMYGNLLERRGERSTSSYATPVFDALAAAHAEDPRAARLWLAELEGDVVAGMWSFYWRRHVVSWISAARELPGRSLSLSTALLGEVMRDAIERGYECFDFNPSAGLKGTVAYKTRFGTRDVPVARFTCTDRRIALVQRTLGLRRILTHR